MEEEQIKRIRKIRNRILIIILATWVVTFGCLIINEEPWSHSQSQSCIGMSKQEKEMYNSRVSKYIGDSKKGSDVKFLIEEIIINNNQNVGETGKFISIYAEDIKSYTRSEELSEVNKKANVYEDENADNNQSNIDKATEEYRKLAQKISSGKEYDIESEYTDGIIYKVTIIGIK